MLKKLFKIFKKKSYITDSQRRVFNSDLQLELEKKIQETRRRTAEIRANRIAVNAFLEILENDGDGYTESELDYLYHEVINQKKI